MLNNVPGAINRMARNVVTNHPNTFNCQLFRKTVTRTAAESVAGNPTMGGLGVLDSMDEEQFEYTFLGNGYALHADGFAPAPMVKRGDANIGHADEFRFLIEPEEPSGHPDWFDVRSHDVMHLLLGEYEQAAEVFAGHRLCGESPFDTATEYVMAHVGSGLRALLAGRNGRALEEFSQAGRLPKGPEWGGGCDRAGP